MKCPYCGEEMEEGGLIVDGVAPGWIRRYSFGTDQNS
ncbi:MAG: PF20097 family protein [Clostridium sp.]|nr:PF20097 family protein [Clostridium sp.]